MKRHPVLLMMASCLLFNSARSIANIPYLDKSFSSPPDSNRSMLIQIPVSTNRELNPGEVFITGGIGYGDMTSLLSPIENYGNGYYNYSSGFSINHLPEFGGSLDMLIARIISMGIGVNYQEIQFVNQNSYQGNYYNRYPNLATFTRLNIGMRNLFYFMGRNSDNVHFYMGVRAGISIWNEQDQWTSNPNYYYYYPVINSTNNTKLSFQVLWGLRYFPVQDLGLQFEAGLGSPYYGQVGITLRLNDRPQTYSVTRAEYRIMNESNQLTHKDSVNIGLTHPPAIKK